MNSIWIPYIIFQNTDDDEAVKVDALTEDGSINTIVSVKREDNFVRSGPEVADEVLINNLVDIFCPLVAFFAKKYMRHNEVALQIALNELLSKLNMTNRIKRVL